MRSPVKKVFQEERVRIAKRMRESERENKREREKKIDQMLIMGKRI